MNTQSISYLTLVDLSTRGYQIENDNSIKETLTDTTFDLFEDVKVSSSLTSFQKALASVKKEIQKNRKEVRIKRQKAHNKSRADFVKNLPESVDYDHTIDVKSWDANENDTTHIVGKCDNFLAIKNKNKNK